MKAGKQKKILTWHLGLNLDKSFDKVIFDFFDNDLTSLTITTRVKEYLFKKIQEDLSKNTTADGFYDDSDVQKKLDYIIKILESKKIEDNVDIESLKADALRDFENGFQ